MKMKIEIEPDFRVIKAVLDSEYIFYYDFEFRSRDYSRLCEKRQEEHYPHKFSSNRNMGFCNGTEKVGKYRRVFFLHDIGDALRLAKHKSIYVREDEIEKVLKLLGLKKPYKHLIE